MLRGCLRSDVSHFSLEEICEWWLWEWSCKSFSRDDVAESSETRLRVENCENVLAASPRKSVLLLGSSELTSQCHLGEICELWSARMYSQISQSLLFSAPFLHNSHQVFISSLQSYISWKWLQKYHYITQKLSKLIKRDGLRHYKHIHF